LCYDSQQQHFNFGSSEWIGVWLDDREVIFLPQVVFVDYLWFALSRILVFVIFRHF